MGLKVIEGKEFPYIKLCFVKRSQMGIGKNMTEGIRSKLA